MSLTLPNTHITGCFAKRDRFKTCVAAFPSIRPSYLICLKNPNSLLQPGRTTINKLSPDRSCRPNNYTDTWAITSTNTPTAEELKSPSSLLNDVGACLRADAVTQGVSGNKIPLLCSLLKPVPIPRLWFTPFDPIITKHLAKCGLQSCQAVQKFRLTTAAEYKTHICCVFAGVLYPKIKSYIQALRLGKTIPGQAQRVPGG